MELKQKSNNTIVKMFVAAFTVDLCCLCKCKCKWTTSSA